MRAYYGHFISNYIYIYIDFGVFDWLIVRVCVCDLKWPFLHPYKMNKIHPGCKSCTILKSVKSRTDYLMYVNDCMVIAKRDENTVKKMMSDPERSRLCGIVKTRFSPIQSILAPNFVVIFHFLCLFFLAKLLAVLPLIDHSFVLTGLPCVFKVYGYKHVYDHKIKSRVCDKSPREVKFIRMAKSHSLHLITKPWKELERRIKSGSKSLVEIVFVTGMSLCMTFPLFVMLARLIGLAPPAFVFLASIAMYVTNCYCVLKFSNAFFVGVGHLALALFHPPLVLVFLAVYLATVAGGIFDSVWRRLFW